MFPSDARRAVTKSRVMWDQGLSGLGKGHSKPAGGLVYHLTGAGGSGPPQTQKSRSKVGHRTSGAGKRWFSGLKGGR